MTAPVADLQQAMAPLESPLRLARKGDRPLQALRGLASVCNAVVQKAGSLSLDDAQRTSLAELVDLTRRFESEGLEARRTLLAAIDATLARLVGRDATTSTSTATSTTTSSSTQNSAPSSPPPSRVSPSSASRKAPPDAGTPEETVSVRRPRTLSAESALAPVSVDGDALSRPLSDLPRVGPAVTQKLAAKGLQTWADVLLNLPRAYQDRRAPTRIADARPGTHVLLEARVVEFRERYGRKRTWELEVEDDTGRLVARWFGFRPGAFRSFVEGTSLVLSGEVREGFRRRVEIIHPDIELGDTSGDDSSFGRIVPVYSEIEGVSARHYRRLAQRVVEACAAEVRDFWPDDFREKYGLPPLGEALAQVHFPPDDAEIKELERFSSPAQRRLVFDELFFVQLGLALKRRGVELERGIPMNAGPDVIARALKRLPFTLTNAQRRAVDGIAEDLQRGTPMNRLLQGDVGSGKTAVALATALVAVENGYQAALMAPTEILAEQHFRGFQRLLGGDLFGAKTGLPPIGVAQLTAGMGAAARRRSLNEAASGTARIIVGTHALLSEGVEFEKLGVVIVDEQHRFGVMQRARLMEKGTRPHVLVMTATPIPRTLALTLYGDLHLSVIDELPPGRTPISTKHFTGARRGKAYELVRKEVRNGRQAYVVLPLVEESDKLDLRAATEEAERLGSEELAGMKIGLVHGRMSADERNRAMEAFRRGDTQVLVATTVIEVGVDVPNASVMVIEHAERFGLSQLHQLRGRVGRGAAKSWCLLIAESDNLTPHARDRLKVMEKHTDGFRIAEEDLKIRGPGEFLGTRQSGTPDLVVADLLRDATVLEEVRKAATVLVTQDPDLRAPQHRAVAEELTRRWSGKLSFARIG